MSTTLVKELAVKVQSVPLVLCATDFSPAANQAAQIAVSLARALGARLELLHVVPMPTLSSADASARLLGVLRDSAEQELARKIESLSGRGVEISARAEFGVVDEVLRAESDKAAPRLLVLGNHGRKGINRFLGSVAERTINQVGCPVLVVPESSTAMREWTPERRRLRITAGVDLSLATEAVAEALRMLTRDVACDLDLVHLYWPPRENARLGIDWRSAGAASDELVDVVLGRELRRRVGHVLESPGREAAIRLCPVWGDEPEPLLREAHAQKADLIVIGVNRRRAGSTAVATLRAADVPVLCVPAADPVEHALATELGPVRSVLIPFDFSPTASAAIPQAYRLVPRGGRVILAHIVEAAPAGLDPEVRADLENDLGEYIPQQGWASGKATHALVYEARTAAEGILQVARRLGVDLIVMSSHGRTGLERALVGSVAEAVLRQAAIPVVVVPSQAGKAT